MKDKAMNDRRVNKLKAIVASEGGVAKFCRTRIKKDSEKPIEPNYISQIINGHRSFGEKAARNMEERCQLPYRYFDEDDLEESAEIFIESDEQNKNIFRKLQAAKLSLTQVKLIENILDGDEDTLTKTESYYAFVSQKRPEYNNQSDPKKPHKKGNNSNK